jgi:multiple sugar transport system ATP-binding protein
MELRFDHVSKSFDHTSVLQDLDLVVEDGTFLALLGASGCGKTTAMRIMVVLETPTTGRVHIGANDVTPLPPRDRNIAMVFQSYALYPHLKVRENISYPLTIRKLPKGEIERQVARVSEMLGLGALLDRKPKQLSGGQRQRVALARAIVRQPDAFVMDEPLSNLDAQLRVQMRTEIKALQREMNTTMLYVTHDQVEAMTMADQVAIMRDGKLQQVSPPDELYARPHNTWIARFVGTPPMNVIAGAVDGALFRSESGSLIVPPGTRAGSLQLGFRSESASLVSPLDANVLVANVAVVENLGNELIVSLPVGDQLVRVRCAPTIRVTPGESCGIAVRPQDLHFFDSETGDRIATPQSTNERTTRS